MKQLMADGTPLDPKRNYEPEYETCSERLNECNRQLYTIYYPDFLIDRQDHYYYSPKLQCSSLQIQPNPNPQPRY